MTQTVDAGQDGPSQARAHAARALELASEGHDAEAASEIEAAARIAPGDVSVHLTRSAIHRNAGRAREALRAAEDAVRLAPDDARAHRMLAVVLERVGRRSEARDAARRAAQLSPEDPAVLRCLADLALDADPAEAERLYRRTLWRDARSIAARVGLARALRRLGRGDEAEDVLVRAEAADPSVGDLRRRASALMGTLIQAAVATLLAVVVLGRVPAFVTARDPALSGLATVVVTAVAVLAPLALLGWSAVRVRRLAHDAPPSLDGREDLRELAEALGRSRQVTGSAR